jgi:hypothetical protein
MSRTNWLGWALVGQGVLVAVGCGVLALTGLFTFANVLLLVSASAVCLDIVFLVINQITPEPTDLPSREDLLSDLQRSAKIDGFMLVCAVCLLIGAAHYGDTRLAWASGAAAFVCTYRLIEIISAGRRKRVDPPAG